MCGRFAIYEPKKEIVSSFKVETDKAIGYKPNYNAAPNQEIPVVFSSEGVRVLDMFKWGLVPFWTKDSKIGHKMINARAETISSKPAYRAAYKFRRCLIPCNGFYEWTGKTGSKSPYFISVKDRTVFGLAGIWEWWGGGNDVLHTCSIIVTSASKAMNGIHDRMPVIISKNDEDKWLTGKDVECLLKSTENIQMHEVSKIVNSATNNSIECIIKINDKTQKRL